MLYLLALEMFSVVGSFSMSQRFKQEDVCFSFKVNLVTFLYPTPLSPPILSLICKYIILLVIVLVLVLPSPFAAGCLGFGGAVALTLFLLCHSSHHGR